MTGFLVFLHAGLVPYGRPIGFRDAASPAMADGASSLDKRKAMAGEPIGLLGVALTSRTFNASTATLRSAAGSSSSLSGSSSVIIADRVMPAILVNGCSGE